MTVTPHSQVVRDSSGTTFTISCVITGLSAVVTTVEWEKDGTTDLGTGFSADVGSGSYNAGTGSQTTTLSVLGSDTPRPDMIFTCKVTNPSDSTLESQIVDLNFYSEFSSSIPKMSMYSM